MSARAVLFRVRRCSTFASTPTLAISDVTLLPNFAPQTVANFLKYMNAGLYNDSVIHRAVQGFIFQGGGYQLINGNLVAIPQGATIPNEFDVSNTMGTLAMALVGTDINSATDQWFFNEVDNSASLDSQSFTVFGRIESSDTASLQTFANIVSVPVPNPSPFGTNSNFSQIPLLNYTSGPAQPDNYVVVLSIEAIAPFR